MNGVRSGVPIRIHSESEPLHVDPFDWGEPVITLGTIEQVLHSRWRFRYGFLRYQLLFLSWLCSITWWLRKGRNDEKIISLCTWPSSLSSSICNLLLIGYTFNAGDDEWLYRFWLISLWNICLVMEGWHVLTFGSSLLLAFLSALIATVIGTFGTIYILSRKEIPRNIYHSNNVWWKACSDVMIGANFQSLFYTTQVSFGFWQFFLVMWPSPFQS